jgi:PAS domain S-box-containing protein
VRQREEHLQSFTIDRDWLCRQIVDQNRLAMICGDTEGIIRLWNKGAEAIFGWTADETIGQSVER